VSPPCIVFSVRRHPGVVQSCPPSSRLVPQSCLPFFRRKVTACCMSHSFNTSGGLSPVSLCRPSSVSSWIKSPRKACLVLSWSDTSARSRCPEILVFSSFVVPLGALRDDSLLLLNCWDVLFLFTSSEALVSLPTSLTELLHVYLPFWRSPVFLFFVACAFL